MEHGKDVVEFAVVVTDKGIALQQLRAAAGADAVLFVGGDLTDEDGFTKLGLDDLDVKVGPVRRAVVKPFSGPLYGWLRRSTRRS